MTRKEASFILANIDRRVCDDELSEALDMSIKALEQEPILDKIKEEIEQIELVTCCSRGGIKQMALDIIEKYKAESEE